MTLTTGLSGRSAACHAEEERGQKSENAYPLTDRCRMIRWTAETAEAGTQRRIAIRYGSLKTFLSLINNKVECGEC